MTTTEHLDKILAKLDELLATAEQRTPGKWQKSKTCVGIPAVMENCHSIALMGIRRGSDDFDLKNHEANAVFIASCAGNAEAGWRATKASIILLINMLKRDHDIETGSAANKALSDILAAWPIESL